MKSTEKKRGCFQRSVLLWGFFVLFLSLMQVSQAEAKERTVKVGFFEFDGYHMVDSSEIRSGYGYEFLQMAATYTDFNYEYVGYDKNWSQMQEMLETGEIDVLTSGQKTEERLQKYDFSKEDIGTSATILSVKSGNDKFVAGKYETYEGMRVGMIHNSSRNDSFIQFAREKGFSCGYVFFENVNEMTKALQRDQIDAIITSNLRAIHQEWILDEFDASAFYLMVDKGNDELLEEFNYAIEQMDNNDPQWRDKLYHKYYTVDSGDAISLSGKEQEYLKTETEKGRVFKAIVNPDRKPYSYFEDGEAKGIIPDLFREIANRTGIPYEIVEVSDRAKYQEAIGSGDIDIVIDGRFAYSEAEDNGYKLTNSYLSTSLAKLIRSDFEGKVESVAALNDPDINPNYRNKIYNSEDTQYYDSIEECIEAVKTGTADAGYFYTYTAQQAVNDDVKNQIMSNVLPEYAEEFSIGVIATEDHRLIAILNKGVNSISSDYMEEIISQHAEFDGNGFTLVGYVYGHPAAAFGVVIVIFAVLLILIMQSMRVKQANANIQKKQELERFIGYICKSNDMVLEVNLVDQICTNYREQEGSVEITDWHCNIETLEKLQERVHPDDVIRVSPLENRRDVDRMLEELKDGRYFECRLRDKDDYVWYSYTLRAIPQDKEHPGNFILFKKNIDDVKKEEEKNRKNLMDALETARAASAAKGTFMSRMSHEIRTPLNAIIGYFTMAKMAEENQEKIMHCIDNGELAAKHLLNIINDVLDISAIESGKMKIANESFDLKNLLTTVSTIFYNQAKNKDVNFEVVLHELTEEWVVGDQLRVNQILMNLLSNAVKFTPEKGKITLVVTQMSSKEEKVHVRFQVTDTGIGMSPEYRNRLFQPFEQESAKTAQKYGGTGLGLSITKNLVTMMKGSIDVESEQNVGTTFTVILVFGRSKENQKLHERTADFTKIRALVVDDEQSASEYVKALLKRCGVKSDTVDSGEKAVKKILGRKGTEYAYDMCILDWNMPGMNGVETARKIREMGDSTMPLIIATAYDITEFEEEAKAAGVNQIIAKPLFQSTMFDLLVDTYGKYEQQQEEERFYLDLKGMHILLAEDNDMNLEIAMDILDKVGILVEPARDGKEAVDLFLSRPKGSFQAILMDVQMPVMDGYEATRTIRQAVTRKQRPYRSLL